MGQIITPRPPWQKPPLGTRLNRGHPLVTELKLCGILNNTTLDSTGYCGLANPMDNPPVWVATTKGPGLYFNAVAQSSHILWSDASHLGGLNEISMEILYYSTVTPVNYPRIAKCGAFEYALLGVNGQTWARIFASTDSGWLQYNAGNNQWVHAVMTYNGDVATLYINGTLRDTDSAGDGVTDAVTSLILGNDTSDADWAGNILFLRVYSKCLTLPMVQYLYEEPYGMF